MEVSGAGALVAGGASGLGAATARALAAAGAEVTIADLDPERGEALAGEIGAELVRADVTDAESVGAAVESAGRAERGLRISVCCAGIGWAERLARARGAHELESFARVVEVNLVGTFNVLRLASQSMIANDPDPAGERGVCVNTASIAAFDGQIGQVAYAASKGGVVGLTLPAARDVASNHRPRPLRHPAACRPPRDRPRSPRRRHPLPLPPRQAGRVRPTRHRDRR